MYSLTYFLNYFDFGGVKAPILRVKLFALKMLYVVLVCQMGKHNNLQGDYDIAYVESCFYNNLRRLGRLVLGYNATEMKIRNLLPVISKMTEQEIGPILIELWEEIVKLKKEIGTFEYYAAEKLNVKTTETFKMSMILKDQETINGYKHLSGLMLLLLVHQESFCLDLGTSASGFEKINSIIRDYYGNDYEILNDAIIIPNKDILIITGFKHDFNQFVVDVAYDDLSM